MDLTPFGFTPTESSAYRALVERGPLGGYALAKALSIARANAYQALNGLEVKGAVERTPGTPRRYRPVRPDALFAAIVHREARKLDALEAALREAPGSAGATLLAIHGARSVEDLMLRTAARTKQAVKCLAPSELLERLAPVWHKRAADGSETQLWIAGEGEPELPIPFVGRVPPEAANLLGSGAAILAADPIVIVAAVTGAETSGYWSNDRVVFGLTGLALRALTA